MFWPNGREAETSTDRRIEAGGPSARDRRLDEHVESALGFEEEIKNIPPPVFRRV